MHPFFTFIRRFRKAGLVVILSAGLFFSFRAVDDYYFEVSKNLDIFSTMFREVNTYYVDSVEPGSLMKTGMDAMLRSLDPYTVFIPESDIEDYRMTHVSAEYGGIGALVQSRNGLIEISDLYEGFPAQKSGLQVGDRILSVNGVSTQGKKVDDVTDVMKGQKGTTVKLIVQREGVEQSIEKSIVRDEIKFKNVPYFGMVSPNTGYIHLSQFLENAAQDVKDALVTLKQNPDMKYLVLDLRGNGGGLLKEAVDIVNLFVGNNQKVVSQKGKIKEMNMEYIASKPPVDEEIPLCVLIDRGSASASEIVTGALQELDRAVVVGQRSYGKGLVQQTYNLSYNTLLKVTIAKYFTPSGRCIQALDYTHRSKDGNVTKVADSLIREFKTKGGRSVFDGSGVYPDVYTDPLYFSEVTMALLSNYLVFDYAGRYFREHSSIQPAKEFRLNDEDYNRFSAFVKDKKYAYTDRSEKKLEELRKALEADKHFDKLKSDYDAMKAEMDDNKRNDLVNHRDEIRQVLEEEIASRYYYEKGRTEAGLKSDPDLKKAIEVLNDRPLHTSILKGEGNYKVIGKPGSEAHAKAVRERQEMEED
ncbi:MAG: hypothetical protein RL021_1796 [Bacteroidota bacterium]|jgi:carboxyl-terminal processing protease